MEEEKSLGLELGATYLYYEKLMIAVGSDMNGQKLLGCFGLNGLSHTLSVKYFSFYFFYFITPL